MTARFNLDGLITVRGGEEHQAYTQVSGNGIVEATKASHLQPGHGTTILPAYNTAQIADVLPSYWAGA
jgi:hypothetical protein